MSQNHTHPTNAAPSRRRFLQTAGVTLGMPLILPSRVWSQETAPSKRLTLGFIGMGKMCRGHLNSFLGRKDCEVVAVCDVDTTRREDAKATVEKAYAAKAGYDYKGCGAYHDFRELLARPDIDAVLIATPDHWHAAIAIAAVNAGKDVYCEKPLTYNIHEAVKLVEAVRKTDRVFQTGSQQRSSKEFRVAAELVRNGVIGELKSITTSFGDPAKPYTQAEEAAEPGLDWDRWCGPGPMVAYSTFLCPRGIHDNFPNWRMTREFGGGMITDWGAHQIDIAQWGLGVDGSGPVEVRAPEKWENAKRGAQLVYANGVVLTHGQGLGCSFYGSEGEVHVNRGKFEFILNGKTIHKFIDGAVDKGTSANREVALTEKEYLADAKVKLYQSKGHQQDWIDAIQSRKRPICDVEIGASSVIACHLMNFAYYYGANMKWDPKTHTVVSGGDQAWTTRASYRGDWIS